MAEYMIHVPGRKAGQTHGLLAELGLDGLADKQNMTWLDSPGPAGDGLLGSWCNIGQGNSASVMAFQPELQRWEAGPGGRDLPAGRFWLGQEIRRPVQPHDILRVETHRGRWVALADGNQWLIPVARHLPHSWGLDEAGDVCRKPKQPFAAFCGSAGAIFLELTQRVAGAMPLTLSCEWSYVCQALAINYKLTPEVISFLGLLDDDAAAAVAAATIELDLIEQVADEKKNAG